ncbi:hypothetical protein LguiA_012595 [Lonicera macranthoides]
MSCVLGKIDEELKEDVLCGDSEGLAITFGILHTTERDMLKLAHLSPPPAACANQLSLPPATTITPPAAQPPLTPPACSPACSPALAAAD